jgi:enamine deaminase RidA (YjgF/YER057c/UK114 family)
MFYYAEGRRVQNHQRTTENNILGEIRMIDNRTIIQRHRPEFLHNKPHFSNLIVTESGKQVHLSGLVASTAEGALVGHRDLAVQMKYIFDTIRETLKIAEATPADVIRQRIFVVDLQLAQRPIIANAMNDFYGEAGSATSTCIGVQALLVEGAMVEIDVTALI